jgi:hypothetical protein
MSRCISVITPVHPDASDYLAEAYQSLLAQQLPKDWEWQWVVQQDGCTHELADLLPADDRISYSTGRQGGNGAAICRTLALARARGELIKVLDADDTLPAGALARDIAILARDPDIGWTTSRVLDLLPDGSTVEFDLDPPAGPIRRGDVLHHWLAHDYRAQVHPATLCVHRELLLILGGWMALPASEDTGLLLSLNAISTGYFIEQVGLLYRKWPKQSTAQAPHADPIERAARVQVIEARARALLTSTFMLTAALEISEHC